MTNTSLLDRWLRRIGHNELQRSLVPTHAEHLVAVARERLAVGDSATATCLASELVAELRGRSRWSEKLAQEVYDRLVLAEQQKAVG